jgi:SOS-response transcriptional repressor LexA
MSQAPTAKQLAVLRAIAQHREQHHCSPTIRELLAVFGHSSTNGMADLLRALRRKGFVDWQDGKQRTLFLTEMGLQQLAGGGN